MSEFPWGIHTIASIWSPNVQAGLEDGRWVFAVAEPSGFSRLRAAWWVLTGRAHALRWPAAGDLEDLLGISRLRRPPNGPPSSYQGGIGPTPEQLSALGQYQSQQKVGRP